MKTLLFMCLPGVKLTRALIKATEEVFLHLGFGSSDDEEKNNKNVVNDCSLTRWKSFSYYFRLSHFFILCQKALGAVFRNKQAKLWGNKKSYDSILKKNKI